jgi:thymidine kinase
MSPADIEKAPAPPPPDARGRLIVLHGPMFAGKTTALLARVAEARARGERVLVVKPERDTRYSAHELVTHAGARIPALNARVAADISAIIDREALRPSLVAIDEVHFFASDAVAPIDALLARGITVVVAGCDIDHFGDVFAPFDALLPRADERLHLRGACGRCGAPSTHSERLVAATDRIIVGGSGEFIATCLACFRPSRR